MTNTPSPDEDRELIEDLRGRNARWQASCDGWIASAREKGHEVTEEQERIMRDNLDGKSADRLESLLSDRAKLEEALEPFAAYYSLNDCHERPLDGALEVPIRALRDASTALNRSTDRAT